MPFPFPLPGDGDGSSLGSSLGDSLGSSDGSSLGSSEGSSEGSSLGSSEGSSVGSGSGGGGGGGVQLRSRVSLSRRTSSGKSRYSSPSREVDMMSPQTCTGKVPPVMFWTPPKLLSACSEPSSPDWNMPTAVTSCGVKPTNHAERKLSEVPVLPATGRPSMTGTRSSADPSVGGPCRATVALIATSSSMTCSSSPSCS